jgi:hypothetical protein
MCVPQKKHSIASLVSLAVGIWEDYSPRHPEDEPRVGWYVFFSYFYNK